MVKEISLCWSLTSEKRTFRMREIINGSFERNLWPVITQSVRTRIVSVQELTIPACSDPGGSGCVFVVFWGPVVQGITMNAQIVICWRSVSDCRVTGWSNMSSSTSILSLQGQHILCPVLGYFPRKRYSFNNWSTLVLQHGSDRSTNCSFPVESAEMSPSYLINLALSFNSKGRL